MINFITGGTGLLRIRTSAAESALPIPNVKISIYNQQTNSLLFQDFTDDNGILEGISLDCPPKYLSLDENNTQKPYATYNLVAESDTYKTAYVNNFQIFADETALAPILMLPKNLTQQATFVNDEADIVDIPEHPLLVGGGGSARAPSITCTQPIVLTEVFIPRTVTVHLGTPSSSAQNVTIPFIDYVKNVASSEIYPTWPEQSLRANIHAQIGVIQNRIYTEWYLSKGYDFTITNSTAYDQYYVHNRTIYESVSVIADDIFNTYLRQPNTVNPFFSEYCDGKQVTCPGMKQWGTVTLAEQGYTAPEILEYYYGDLEIIRTSNVQDIPQSYPGTPITIGSTGTSVKIIQRQLNRIADDYPAFGTVEVDGVYGSATAEVVKRFQTQFNLTADGIVGRSTWYKISYIYVSVKDLAELTSEGEKPTGDLVEGQYPGTALSVGSSGDNVLQVQFWLNEVGQYIIGFPEISVDGQFGPLTKAAVQAFQLEFGLSNDGIVGESTWNELYKQYSEAVTDSTPGTLSPGQYPGTALSIGSTGDDVKRMQFFLRIVARNNSSIPDLSADGIFGTGTRTSVIAFQNYYDLSSDGIVGQLTWNKIFEVYTDMINGLLTPGARPGVYPGSSLKVGDTGTNVKEIQYYLYLLSAYYVPLPVIEFDGVFGAQTEQAVKIWQEIQGLTIDGIVGPATWNSVYAQFSKLRTVDGPVSGQKVTEYPGYTLEEGMQGDIVKFLQYMLQYVSSYYETVRPVTNIDGNFNAITAISVESFQQTFKLEQTGIVDKDTWDLITIMYLTCSFNTGNINKVPEGQYAGNVLVLGSTGLQVYRLQTYIDSIAIRYCTPDFVNVDGIFNGKTLAAVESFQENFGLQVTGFVDKLTWDTIYAYYVNNL